MQFEDSPQTMVITTKKIVVGADWIAQVTHDSDDGAWQFHDSDENQPDESEAVVVSLKNILEIDPSIQNLADLPVGWIAKRNSKDSDWRRYKFLRNTF